MSQLQGKVAIVTGGGSGFGEGIVKLYAKEAPASSSPTSTRRPPTAWQPKLAPPHWR